MIKEIRLPAVGENIDSGDIVKVLVAVGDIIALEQPIVEVETDKAIFEVPSTEKGKVIEILVKEGDKIKIDEVILRLESDSAAVAGKPAKEIPPEESKQRSSKTAIETPERVAEAAAPAGEAPPASPSVRRLARELGVDLVRVAGSGPGGRISEDDVKLYAKAVITGVTGAVPSAGTKPLPDFSRWGETTREPMNKVRTITSESTGFAWRTIPHVTQFDKADITELEEFRRKHKGKVGESGGKLTVTAFLLKVVATALKVHPRFNASIDTETGEIIYKKYYNIGVAVDTDRGLLVPVIRDVHKKNVAELSLELTEISGKARTKKIAPDDLDGGNFTISNLGGIGGTNFTPIVYWPQVAILGVARTSREPLFIEDEIKPRLLLPLALSYDHRVIDGADGARFLRWIVDALEDPFLLALED